MSKRGNSEGSLYQSGEGWRGYVWCIRPDGTRYRKYVRGKTYEEARDSSKSVLRCVTGRACVRRPADGVGAVLAVTVRSDFWPGAGCARDTRGSRYGCA